MNIKLTTWKSITEEKEYKVLGTHYAPGWVWPFDCDECTYEIDKEEHQIIVRLEHNEIVHFHERCWEKLTKL